MGRRPTLVVRTESARTEGSGGEFELTDAFSEPLPDNGNVTQDRSGRWKLLLE